MRSTICTTGETRPGRVSVTLERDALTLVIKGVPAEVCEICGERYLDQGTTASLLAQAERAAEAGVQVEIRSYQAA
jgi:YgiT-type zinc finger domain-containing protein